MEDVEACRTFALLRASTTNAADIASKERKGRDGKVKEKLFTVAEIDLELGRWRAVKVKLLPLSVETLGEKKDFSKARKADKADALAKVRHAEWNRKADSVRLESAAPAPAPETAVPALDPAFEHALDDRAEVVFEVARLRWGGDEADLAGGGASREGDGLMSASGGSGTIDLGEWGS